MRTRALRLALTGGAVTLLAVAGIGLAAAAHVPAAPSPEVAAAAATGAPEASRRPDRQEQREGLSRLRGGWAGGRLLRAGRHLVHAEVTITGRVGELITFHLDHGTVESVGGGSLAIAEAGGGLVTVALDDATRLFVGRAMGDLTDLGAGDEVFVRSRVDGDMIVAKLILIVPAAD